MRDEVWFSRLTPNLCVLLVIPFYFEKSKDRVICGFLILGETAVAAPHVLLDAVTWQWLQG